LHCGPNGSNGDGFIGNYFGDSCTAQGGTGGTFSPSVDGKRSLPAKEAVFGLAKTF
jgi:hypothetical protein